MSEDSLSNDEYDCASPDDISLPPLAETPESNMVQSDFEEGFCFSSHSVHIRQHRESSRTESCQMPPIGLHSSTRSVSGLITKPHPNRTSLLYDSRNQQKLAAWADKVWFTVGIVVHPKMCSIGSVQCCSRFSTTNWKTMSLWTWLFVPLICS